MKFAIFALPVLVALSACAGSSSTNSATDALRAKVTALAPTATMPTGTATYTGKFLASNVTPSTTNPAMKFTTKYDSDLNLAANFDTRRVTTTLSNTSFVVTNNVNNSVGVVITSGTATGSGTITGNSINLGTITGIVKPVSYTLNDVAQTPTAAGSYTVSNVTNVTFVGPNADGIYQNGTATVDGVANTSTEILATRN